MVSFPFRSLLTRADVSQQQWKKEEEEEWNCSTIVVNRKSGLSKKVGMATEKMK
jgi:hypothetical protein